MPVEWPFKEYVPSGGKSGFRTLRYVVKYTAAHRLCAAYLLPTFGRFRIITKLILAINFLILIFKLIFIGFNN